jgi:hypothetical protein
MDLLHARANIVSERADRILPVRRWLTSTDRQESHENQIAGYSLS